MLGPDPSGIRWRSEVRAEVMVHADRDQLFRVLMNLGRNAVQALGEAGGADLDRRLAGGRGDR